MILKLESVKNYCKKNNITDGGVRKKIKNNTLNSCSYNDQVYIILEDNFDEVCKNKIKLLNSNIKSLRNEVKIYTKQDELVEQQKVRIEKLEARIEKLEDKLDKQIETKESLYEKVIGHMTMIENKGKEST